MTSDLALNISANMPPEQILLNINNQVTIPTLIIFWIISITVFGISGLLIIDKNNGQHPYRKFGIIWIISAVLSLVFLMIISAMPNSIHAIVHAFSTIFST